MKYKFKVSNLDCPNCAKKIEDYLNKQDEINNCILNFTKLTLEINCSWTENVQKRIEKLIHEVDSTVKIYSTQEKSKESKIKIQLLRLIIGILLAIIAYFVDNSKISTILFAISYITLLSKCLKNAWNLAKNAHTINENLLLSISCIGAFILGEIHEGLMVIILYEIGKILETLAVDNSRKSITELMDIKPEYANLKQKNNIQQVQPEKIKIGDCIVIKRGEKVPLDGIVIKGNSKINKSALTGESKLVDIKENDEILSGSINEGNIIEVKVIKTYENSTVARILELVENASNRKSVAENFVSRAAKIYTPIVLLLALLVFLLLPIVGLSWRESIYRSLSFLVVSCPCAIAISVPLAYFTGIGTASKKGILIKGSDYLDSLRQINKIIFDKTGTITTGKQMNCQLTIIDKNYKKQDIIDYYVFGENYSTHPIAKSILNYYSNHSPIPEINKFKEISGKGIEYELDNNHIRIGSSSYTNTNTKDNSIYLEINNKIIAKIDLIDDIKQEAEKVIKNLYQMNITPLMFTGDEQKIALDIANKIGIKSIKYELLPEEKYQYLSKEIENNKGKTAFIGDGINDAPSLRLADIGISMGSVGASSAIEASDIVIANDNLDKILEAIMISKYTDKIVKENLIFSIGVKLLVLTLCTLGITGLMWAVFADTGVTLIAILNTTRILKYSKICQK